MTCRHIGERQPVCSVCASVKNCWYERTLIPASVIRWHHDLIDIPMSDRRNQRDRRRRQDADDCDPSYTMPEFRARSSPPVNTPRSSEPVAAVVKWFDLLRGFGFVKVEDG